MTTSASSAPAPRPRGVSKEDWDHLIISIGKRKHGKTAFMLERALELGQTPAYVIAHDPGHRIKAWTPKRGTLPAGVIHRHQSLGELAAALKTHPAGVHTVSTPDAEPVLRYALELGKASRMAGGGAHGVPVVVWVNEVTSCESGNPTRFGGALNFTATQGRHELVALLIEGQSSRLIGHQLWSNCTEAHFFKVSDRKALRRLEEFEVPPSLLAKLPKLARYARIDWDPDDDDED